MYEFIPLAQCYYLKTKEYIIFDEEEEIYKIKTKNGKVIKAKKILSYTPPTLIIVDLNGKVREINLNE